MNKRTYRVWNMEYGVHLIIIIVMMCNIEVLMTSHCMRNEETFIVDLRLETSVDIHKRISVRLRWFLVPGLLPVRHGLVRC